MKYLEINNEDYLTIKDVYMNLCVARNAIIKKINKLEKDGYILRIENKRPSIYISKKGYEKLKQERIDYLNNLIINEHNQKLKEYYEKLRESIEKPELWNEFHQKEVVGYIFSNM